MYSPNKETEPQCEFNGRVIAFIKGELPVLQETFLDQEPLAQLSRAYDLVELAYQLELPDIVPYQILFNQKYANAGGLGSLAATRTYIDYLGRHGDFDTALSIINQATLLPPNDASTNPFQQFVYHLNKAHEHREKGHMLEALGRYAIQQGKFNVVEKIHSQIIAHTALDSSPNNDEWLAYSPQPGESLYVDYAKTALEQEDIVGFEFWNLKITSRIYRSDMNEYLIIHYLDSLNPNYDSANEVFDHCENLVPYTVNKLHLIAAEKGGRKPLFTYHHLEELFTNINRMPESSYRTKIEFLCQLSNIANEYPDHNFKTLAQKAIKYAQVLHKAQSRELKYEYEWFLASKAILHSLYVIDPSTSENFLHAEIQQLPQDSNNLFLMKCEWADLNPNQPFLLSHLISSTVRHSRTVTMFDQTKMNAQRLSHLIGILLDKENLTDALSLAAILKRVETFASYQDPYRLDDKPNAITPISLAKNENSEILFVPGSGNLLDSRPYYPQYPEIYSQIAQIAVSLQDSRWVYAYNHISKSSTRIHCLTSIMDFLS